MFSRIPLLIIVFNLIFSQVFFSEYAEGTSNNKYLEIYNAGDSTVDLTLYAYPNANGGSDGSFEYWNTFEDGATVAPGDVYVICHGSSDPFIQSECDETHLYLSNGDDGYCLVSGVEDDFIVVDCIGDWNEDPGTGWDVAGVSNGTVNHTLARKSGIVSGNLGNWSNSAGTNSDDSEWVVLDQNVWTFLGTHPHEDFSGGSADGGTTGGDDGGTAGSEICDDDIDNDGDGFIDCDDFDCNCGSEDCSNGIDDDGDSYIDCDDFNCSSDPACGGSGGTGSCAEYGCVGYTPSNACQCNDLCSQYNNCCDDYEQVCAGDDGGSTGDEICDDGIDNDGDGYIDCDDWNCDGTTGALDPACSSVDGGTTGGSDGGDPVDVANLFFSEYAEGSGYNKYLEIYNADDFDVDLTYYSLSTCSNGCDTNGVFDYPDNFTFDSGSILAPGEIFIICNPGTTSNPASNEILNECDGNFTYFSNGNDAMALTLMSTGTIIDIIGDTLGDPGSGWSVGGVSDGTINHTLVRKPTVTEGNSGDWSLSAGVSAETSQWIVYDSNNWDNIGVHFVDDGSPIFGCTDENAYNYNSYANIDDGTCTYATQVSINAIQGEVDDSPYADTPVIASGVVTGVSYNGFYMQDGTGAWNGIWVYAQNVSGFNTVLEGDLVEVQGLVIEYNNLTEIEAVSLSVQSSNNALPEPVEINTGGLVEAYEGVLVKFLNASCVTTPSDDTYGEWQVNDGSGLAIIDDKLLEDYSPDLDQLYDIVGVGDFSYGAYKVQAKEVVAVYQAGFPVADAGVDQEVDEGASVTLDGSSSYTSEGIIINYLWNQTGGVNVDLGDYESPTVSFTAPNEVTLLTFTLQITNSLGNADLDYVSVQVGEPVEICDDGVDNDGDPYVDCDDFDCNDDPACASGSVEICDDGIDNDGDPYIDCDDYDCNNDPACGGTGVTGSCAEYGCVGFTPGNSCQCNDLCSQYNNCCDDYEEVCAGDDGGSTGDEICDDGIDNDGDGYIDCEDWNCDGTIGDLDPVCEGATTGGGDGGSTGDEICDDGIDNDGDGFIDCDDFDCNCGSEDCSNGIDDDGDSYIDCDDFNCSSDPACGGSGGTGSCAEYGCVGYTPSNACQCNDLCSQYNNCCDDYEEVCAGDDGGSTGDEICDDGIDNDGDGYIDCDDWNCDGTTGDLDPACEGSTTGGGDGGSDTCEGSSLDNLFFSEYAEGSSNNKYLEIYNAGDTTVNLCGYAFPNSTNGADNDGVYDYWNTFDDGASIDSGEVFVICHPAFDESLPGFCDQTHTYLSNGDDGFCLVYGTETNYSLLDCIGTWSSEDPGFGWEVAGISDGTKDHTLVRKASVESGNQGDWDSSAGTNADDSEWLVFEVDTWDNLGSHEYDGSSDDCLVGDANGDGIVNVVDIVQMVSIILDNDSGYNACGDSNNDGILNVVDIVAVVSIILGS